MPHLHDTGQQRLPKPTLDSAKASVPLLLADLASQHERVQLLSADLSGALSSVQSTLGQVQQLLSPNGAEAPTNGAACFAAAPASPTRGAAPKALGGMLEEPVRQVGLSGRDRLSSHSAHGSNYSGDQESEPSVGHAPEGVLCGDHPSAMQLLQAAALPRSRSGLSGGPAGGIFGEQADGTRSSSDPGKFFPRRALSGITEHFSNVDSEMSTVEHMHKVRQNAILRLQARLGKRKLGGFITADEVYLSVTSLGLEKYSLVDMQRWLVQLNAIAPGFIHLPSRMARKQSTASTRAVRAVSRFFPGRRASTMSSIEKEPAEGEDASGAGLTMRCKVFVDILLNDEALGDLDVNFQEMSLTIREVLLSGDANRLVAELTNVCVDDVATPNDRVNWMGCMELIVCVAIIMNGVLIGLQSHADVENTSRHDGWFWANVAFITFFILEVILRSYMHGVVELFTGTDHWWNIFDVVILAVSVFDIIVEAVSQDAYSAPLTIMRIMRLLRLTRLVRIFRLRFLKELTLMVRGLLGGLYTLFWAIVLLFFTLYMVACIATTTIGRSIDPVPEVHQDGLFSSVPMSILTSFRCFMSDCTTSGGKPIVKLLADRYGPLFILSYLASTLFVAFGLFNLIAAIYVENTLNAAKLEGDKSRAARQRESIRVAKLSRELLKKFSAMQKLWTDVQDSQGKEVKELMNLSSLADIGTGNDTVSKEMFLCLIQDPSVQKLLDDLDIPPERAALFDTLDADGSGGLEMIELITGLLRVRGEAKKSEVVGTLLAVRAIQDMLREQAMQLRDLQGGFERLSPTAFSSPPFAGNTGERSPSTPSSPLRSSWRSKVLISNGDGT